LQIVSLFNILNYSLISWSPMNILYLLPTFSSTPPFLLFLLDEKLCTCTYGGLLAINAICQTLTATTSSVSAYWTHTQSIINRIPFCKYMKMTRNENREYNHKYIYAINHLDSRKALIHKNWFPD
jgi:hypothetical protein